MRCTSIVEYRYRYIVKMIGSIDEMNELEEESDQSEESDDT